MIRYTVAEYAKLKGISTQTVYNQIKSGVLNSFKTVSNGKTVTVVEIDEDISKEIGSDFKNSFKPFESNLETAFDLLKAENEDLRKQITAKDEQLAAKDAIIKEKDDLLAAYTQRFADLADRAQTIATQAQALQAADKKLLPESGEPTEPTEQKQGFFKRLFGRR